MKKTISIKEAISNGWRIFKTNWKFWFVVSLLLGGTKTIGGLGSSISGMANPAIYNQDLENTSKMEYMGEPEGFEYSDDLNGFGTFGDKVLGSKTVKSYEENIDKGNTAVAIVVTIIVFIIVSLIALAMILTNLIFRMGHLKLKIDAARGNELDYKTILSQVNYKKAFRLSVATFLAALLTGIGFLLLIVPGFIFLYKFILIPYVIVEEDTGILEAFKRSSKLTKGVRFKLFLFSIVIFFMFILGLITLVGWILVAFISQFAMAYIYVKLSEQENAPQVAAETVPTPPAPEPKIEENEPTPPLQEEAIAQQNANAV